MGKNIFHHNIEGIHGVLLLTGWHHRLQQIESGDEQEIQHLVTEQTQQRNEDNDHAQSDIIYQVHMIGWQWKTIGTIQKHQHLISECN